MSLKYQFLEKILRLIVQFVIFIFCFNQAMAQDPILIGRIDAEETVITIDTSKIAKAMKRTFADGTIVDSMYIESEKGVHYLVGWGWKSGYRKIIAVQLVYNMSTRTFSIVQGMGHVTCASAACNNCKPLKENGIIIACHCVEKQTVSNQCNFTRVAHSLFYNNLSHFYKVDQSR